MASADAALAARIRGARGYSGMSQPDMAKALGMSVTTLSRIENARADVDLRIAYQVAELCAVPRWFIDHGFDVAVAPEEEATLAERVEALESQMQLMIRAGLARAGAAAAQARSSEEPDATPATPATQGHSR